MEIGNEAQDEHIRGGGHDHPGLRSRYGYLHLLLGGMAQGVQRGVGGPHAGRHARQAVSVAPPGLLALASLSADSGIVTDLHLGKSYGGWS